MNLVIKAIQHTYEYICMYIYIIFRICTVLQIKSNWWKDIYIYLCVLVFVCYSLCDILDSIKEANTFSRIYHFSNTCKLEIPSNFITGQSLWSINVISYLQEQTHIFDEELKANVVIKIKG